MLFVVLEIIRRYGSYSLAEYEAAAAGIVWLVAFVGIPSRYRTGRYWQTARTRSQTEHICLQRNRGRSLDQIMRDSVIFEFIARRRIGELARSKASLKAKRFIRGAGSERGGVDSGPRLDRYVITCR